MKRRMSTWSIRATGMVSNVGSTWTLKALVVTLRHGTEVNDRAEVLVGPLPEGDPAEARIGPLASADIRLHVGRPPLRERLCGERLGVLAAETVPITRLPSAAGLLPDRCHGSDDTPPAGPGCGLSVVCRQGQARRCRRLEAPDQHFYLSGRGDLNPRPQRPERCALTKLRHHPWSVQS